MKISEILAMLKEDGWYLVGTKSGRVTVPGRPSDDLAPGTRNSIFKQAGWM
jgi:predicted RNA binding protein YcfA (HicA-like mRNA interferase family)